MNRRHFLAAAAALAATRPSALLRAGSRSTVFAPRPRPSAAQLRWQRDELAMFVHFGVNTFTDREWGDGHEDPSIFAPTRLDARQWARAARAAGFRAMILTAKHHDGFCLWPTSTTRHSVVASPWRGGQGDVVREFVDACRAEELRPGLYLSPWDRNNPAYGDSPRYNDVYAAQLTELMTRYGPLAEAWFDGANGEGPNGRRQQYDWPRFWGIVRRYQPDAVIFSDAGPDVRWCGNEAGQAGDPNWSTVDPDVVPYPGATGAGVTPELQHGDPAGTAWRPAEADVSIRPGWFYHAAEDARVRTADDLVALYLSSVGRNSKLLLNVPPTREGLLHDTDVARLREMHERLTTAFERDVAGGHRVVWRRTGARASAGELTLRAPTDLAYVRLAEEIAHGQRVRRFAVTAWDGGSWRPLAEGTTIGYARILRVAAPAVRRVRVELESVDDDVPPVSVKLFAATDGRAASG